MLLKKNKNRSTSGGNSLLFFFGLYLAKLKACFKNTV